jgi:hypothetical protein
MNTEFTPPRRTGLIVSLILVVLLSAGTAWSLNQAITTPVGPLLGGYLLLVLLLGLPVPLVFYRLYSLFRSSYRLQTGSIRLVWGLRIEEIPMEQIVRLGPAAELRPLLPRQRLPLPLLRWPGALVGERRIDRRMRVEFLAAGTHGLILIETNQRIYAISPEDPAAFLHTFRRMTEIGTIEPVTGESVQVAAVVGNLRESAAARNLVIAAVVLAAAFAVWVLAGVRPAAGLRYPLGETGRFVNSSQVLIMPVLNLIYMLADLLVGVFFFRREETRPLAFLLWISSVLASVFFFVAVGSLIR